MAGTGDLDWFLEGGRLAEESLRESLACAGTRLEDMGCILDFGCGCGRVTRRLAGLPGEVRGSDVDGPAVDWCRENLTFATFTENELEPPLPFPAEDVDFVYAFSVLTHLPVPVQHAWVDELARVLRPGGLLLVSTHGDALPRAPEPRRARVVRARRGRRPLRGGGRHEPVHGLPSAGVRPRAARRGPRARRLEAPEGAKGNPHQDLFLFRKRAGSSAADQHGRACRRKLEQAAHVGVR